MLSRRAVTAIATAFLTFQVACTDSTGPESELKNARARWLAHAPASYSYTVFRGCFCTSDARGPVRVTVRDGVAESRLYTETGAAVPQNYAQFFPTVDALFAQIDSLRTNRVARLDVTYDATYGFPTRIDVDVIAHAADDEFTYETSGFVAR